MKTLMKFTILLIALSSISCSGKKSEISGSASLYLVKRDSISKVVSVSGKIEAARKVVITAPLGNKIKNLNVNLGQKVSRGDILLEYDESSVLAEVTKLRNAMAGRRADMRNQELQLEALRKKLERARALFAKKIAPARDVEDAERELVSARNSFNARRLEIDSEKEVLERSEQNLKNLKIRSPIPGRVTSLWLGNDTFNPGTAVREGEKLVTVADTDQLVVEGKLAEADLALINESLPVNVSMESMPGEEFKGKILKISPTPEVDPNSGVASFPIRIEIKAKADSIRPGMSASASIEVAAKENALVIPLNAIKQDGNQEFVEVLEGSALSKRVVKLGLVSDLAAEVLQGLQENDKVRVP